MWLPTPYAGCRKSPRELGRSEVKAVAALNGAFVGMFCFYFDCHALQMRNLIDVDCLFASRHGNDD